MSKAKRDELIAQWQGRAAGLRENAKNRRGWQAQNLEATAVEYDKAIERLRSAS